MNLRREECQKALAILREIGFDISSICALNQEDLPSLSGQMDEALFRRVTHLVEEHARVVYAIDALNTGKIERFGELLYTSHSSSRDLYEVSHENLDLLVELLREQDHVFGARLTGAGLGGSTIACVSAKHAEEVLEETKRNYEDQTGIEPNGMVCQMPGGAITSEM